MYRPWGTQPGYLTEACKIFGAQGAPGEVDTKNGGVHGIGQRKSHTWKMGVHVNGKISMSTLSNRLNPYVEALTPSVTSVDRTFLEVIKI